MPNQAAARLAREVSELPDDSPSLPALRMELALSVPGLDRFLGCSFHPISVPPPHANWSIFNPSIAINPAGGYYAILRCSTWPLLTMYPTYSEMWLATLDDQFALLNARRISPLNREYIQGAKVTFGPEDARLFRIGDQWLASAAFGDATECAAGDTNKIRMGLIQFDANFNWRTVITLPGQPSTVEKNWMPLNGEIAWIYSPATTTCCEINAATQKIIYHAAVTTPKTLRRARGGSQLIPVGDNKLLAVVHETIDDARPDKKRPDPYSRAYLHRFVLYNRQPLRAVAVSQPFYFLTRASTEFAAGLAVRENRVIVSFGHHDRSAWLAELPLNDVMQSMESC